MMGHTETEVTERYAHLRADLLPAEDRGALAIDMDGLHRPEWLRDGYSSHE